ncbi:TetR/AcrR family transcriptional regulator [Actinoplanes sp. NPDC051343]|jgi:AcrR family transcriptional regulator|uniref:TetR/AcrR family transcriptional regulator n=1 Tax=Actinoplanes sp. NPDC051343 TaxID=3363906 RepID=UPI0037B53C5D
MADDLGLRERKKEATRVALRAAALRLALERGPGNLRVDDIAEAAGVSVRTYNNYFSSREQAIIAAVTAERASRIAAAVADRPAEVGLADAVIDAVAGQYADPSDDDRAVMLMITSTPALRACYVDTVAAIEEPLAAAIAERCPGVDRQTAEVLAAGVGAATRLALRRWLDSARTPASMHGFVIPAGSLPEIVRSALTPLGPALDQAGHR